MTPIILGWLITVFGIFFILLGLIGAAKETFRNRPAAPASNFISGFIDALKALTELIKALATAPLWLALTGVGIVLIFIGQRVIGNL